MLLNMDEEEHVKEVYARFGLAMYCAQLLEHDVVNALVIMDLIPSRRHTMNAAEQWGALIDAFMDERFELTMGRLFESLRSVTLVPFELDSRLRAALKKRNWLAHGFFRDRTEQFMTPAGRDSMLAEIEEITALFTAADRQLGEIVEPLRRKAGLTDEMIAKAYAENMGRLGW